MLLGLLCPLGCSTQKQGQQAAPSPRTRLLLLGWPSEKSAQRLTPAGAAAGWLAAPGAAGTAAPILGVTGAAAPAGITRVAWSHLAAAGEVVRAGAGAAAGAGATTGLARQFAIHSRASCTLAGMALPACRGEGQGGGGSSMRLVAGGAGTNSGHLIRARPCNAGPAGSVAVRHPTPLHAMPLARLAGRERLNRHRRDWLGGLGPAGKRSLHLSKALLHGLPLLGNLAQLASDLRGKGRVVRHTAG